MRFDGQPSAGTSPWSLRIFPDFRQLAVFALTLLFACDSKSPQGAPKSKGREPVPESIFDTQDPNAFSNDLGYFLVRQDFERLKRVERQMAAIWELEAEVNNGGFDQYFSNSAGDHWREALSGLQAIGANGVADLLQRAVSVFPGGEPSTDRDRRQEQAAALPSAARSIWSDLDGRFYDSPDPLARLVQKFALAHRSEFR